jgi:hypothetical protein
MSSYLSLLMKMYGCSPLFFYTKTYSRASQIPNRVRIMNQVYGDYVDQYYIDKKNQFRIKPDPSKVFGLVFITLFLHVRI